MPLKVDRLITDTVDTTSLLVNGINVTGKDTTHYVLNMSASTAVTVNTTTGIIDIINITAVTTPGSAFTSSVAFSINNESLDLTVIDNIYVQFSVYYNQTATDNAIPYLISTGVDPTLGLEFTLYNANPAADEANNFLGELYVYFELYTIN